MKPLQNERVYIVQDVNGEVVVVETVTEAKEVYFKKCGSKVFIAELSEVTIVPANEKPSY